MLAVTDTGRNQSEGSTPGGREQVSTRLDRVAHHVAQHAAALLLAIPEPRLVRAGVLFCTSRDVGRACLGSAAPPDELMRASDGGRVDLVLEVGVQQADRFDELEHFLCFGNRAAERLLDCDAREAGPGSHFFDDGANHVETGVVRCQYPHGIHALIAHERPHVLVHRDVGAHADLPCDGSDALSALSGAR